MTPLLFVLGAGASHSYGFPTGSQLMEIMGQELTNNGGTTFYNTICNEFGSEKVREVGKTIIYSPLQSIDRLIANHGNDKEFVRIGKLTIALVINRYEDEAVLFEKHKQGKSKESWYGYLFNKMFDLCKNDPRKIFDLPISFVTYNYDRSLEQFIFKSLRYSFPLSDQEAIDIAFKFISERIFHIHGDLGSIFGIGYQNHDSNFQTINKMAEGIRIVHEGNDNHLLENVSNIIRQTRRIYFLGFGYSSDNLDKLWFPKDGNRNGQYQFHLFGSRYGIKFAEINDIRSKFSARNMDIDFHESVQQIPAWDLDVYNYIRNFVDFG